MKEFFIRYTHSEKMWAEGIVRALSGDGHATVGEPRDFGAGWSFRSRRQVEERES